MMSKVFRSNDIISGKLKKALSVSINPDYEDGHDQADLLMAKWKKFQWNLRKFLDPNFEFEARFQVDVALMSCHNLVLRAGEQFSYQLLNPESPGILNIHVNRPAMSVKFIWV